MTIGERIKQRRLELGMTQDEVAKKAGYKSRSSVNKIELSRDLPLTKVKAVAKILECTPSYLLGWEDNNDIIESAETDVKLSNMDNRMKEYALKMDKLSKENQELIMQMIDKLSEK
ncbi:MAG: helix-turn-helix transcriptional regulator [Bacteroidales bacterium]|nr:helix-turn-helix transcriptional regulator [Bacteroidales bacterium]